MVVSDYSMRPTEHIVQRDQNRAGRSNTISMNSRIIRAIITDIRVNKVVVLQTQMYIHMSLSAALRRLGVCGRTTITVFVLNAFICSSVFIYGTYALEHVHVCSTSSQRQAASSLKRKQI